MAVGRISGPLLKANLLRDGVNLAFETDLLFLDVVNGRIGIKTASPTHDLTINGTTRTTTLEVTTEADIATFNIQGDTISSSSNIINLEPSSSNPVVYQGTLVTGNLQLSTNLIETTGTNTDLVIETTGSGQVNINSNVLVNGDLHATGNITADGNITIGDADTDSITFNADINSNIIPDVTNTYDLGSDPATGGKEWRRSFIKDIFANTITANNVTVDGINLALPQGNIIYVATTGNDNNSGIHEHDPVLTIAYALSQATVGDTVYIYPGVYEEVFPLEIPPGVTVHGTGIRAVTVKPTAATMYLDAFHMNGEATVEDLTVSGFHHDPTGTYFEYTDNSQGTGHAFRFSANTTTTTRSPYIRNVTVLTFGTASVLSVDSIKTEVIATLTRIKDIVDELVVNGSITKTTGNPENPVILLPASDGATGALLQDLIDTVVYVINNGTLKANLPSISANGASVSSGVLANAAAILEANRNFIVEESYAYAEFTYPGTCDETLTKRDMGLVLDALIYDITRGGNEHSVYAGLGFWVQPTDDPRGYARGDSGHGALVDGSAMTAQSTTAAMLFHSVTFITPGADTLIATNGARIEWLNSFTYFANKGLYAYSSEAGIAGDGKTRLRINTRTGTWEVGNTLSYYDTDGTTVLASGTIESIDGDYVNLNGRQLGFETVTDRIGKTVYPQGDAKLSTAQAKFGSTSLLLDGTGDYATVASQPDFNFGTEDFCLETWVYPTTTGAYRTIFDFRNTAPADGNGIIVGLTDTNALYFYYNFGFRIGPVGSVPVNTWTHIAIARVSGNTRAFINGVQVGATYADTNNYPARTLKIGSDPNGSFLLTGHLDDLRISKGVGRYSTDFTAPAAAFVGDLNTVLLLHFNGPNNSTTFLDDGITYQDLRTSAGGTALLINFADYSDFGAEIRSIGSANIYGTYGAYGDGPGVIAYLISQNFAYVGAGKLTSNDPNDRIEANEVVELNNAQIYYTSVDNEGNFSVGDSFFVNQKTGEVLFNGTDTTITSSSGVVFTDGTNTTTITATNIDTGNIRISGNTVESVTGNLNITAASGTINLQNNTYITGNLDVTGDVTIGGNIQIGDQSSDTVSFVAGINSNLTPSTTATYDLGTDLLRWNNVYVSRAEVDGLVIDNNTIQTTSVDADLTLIANGTGRIYIPSSDVQIDQNLTVTTDFTVTTGTTYLKNTDITGTLTQIGDLDQTGNFTTSGNTEVTGNITATGYLQLPQIRLEGNTVSTSVTDTDLNLVANGTGNVVVEGIKFQDNNIQSTALNSDITLIPQGTGSVIINNDRSLQIPVGTTAERPASPVNGMIRYNTDLSRYEGWNGAYWLTLSGVQDVDGNTYIKAEATPGANDNILYFYADGNLMVTIDSTKLFTERLQTDNLDIYDNTITSILPDTNINLTTTGTGGVSVGNHRFYNNTITNTVSGSITEFVQSGTGYVKIAGTNGVVIPSGVDTERPSNAIAGMMRFNTQQQLVEVYNGTSWTSVAGTSSGVTFNEAEEIGIGIVLTLG